MGDNLTRWCPHKKRKFGHRPKQRENHVERQGTDSYQLAKREASEKNTTTTTTLISDFWPPEVRVVKSLRLWFFAALASKIIHLPRQARAFSFTDENPRLRLIR